MQSYCYVTSNNEQFFIGYERVVEAANYNVYCISCHRSHCYKFPSSLILHSIIYLTYSTPFPPPPLNAHIEKYFKISQLLLMEARVSFLDHVCVFHSYWHVQSSREESQDFSLSILSKYDLSGEMVVKIVHKMIFMRIVWKASHKDLHWCRMWCTKKGNENFFSSLPMHWNAQKK